MAERNTVTEANSPDNAPPQPLLDDEQLDRLDDFLDSEQVGEDALDLISAHGFLVALAVAPSEQPTEQWLEELFQGEPNYRDAAEREEIIQLLTLLRDNTMAVLEQGGLPELPFELTLDGLPAEEKPLFRVRFSMRDIWGEAAENPDDTLDAELYAHWLEKVDHHAS